MNLITHKGVYQIQKDGLFDRVNSYAEMNKAIKKYGGKNEDYNVLTGMPFEIYTMYFCIRYDKNPILGIENIKDTSANDRNAGFDFTFTNLEGGRGHIQSKWRENPLHQFNSADLATNDATAYHDQILPTDNILFINFDDNKNLFHYEYKAARKCRRIIDRKAQEEYILRDPNFWNDFRKCIKLSAFTDFKNPPKLRIVQDWILNGNENYEGTQAVIDGKYHKGRTEATTATGKTLCIYHNILRVFKTRDVCVLMVPWLGLINQTFRDFYIYKMFGCEKEGNINCIFIRSGEKPQYNPLILDVLQTLDPFKATGKILENIACNKKTVVFITKASYFNKWVKISNIPDPEMVDVENDNIDADSGILDMLFERDVKKEQIFEIMDEYHNLIPTTGLREDQEKMALFLETFSDRNSGTLFYSASNKRGDVISSFNEKQFGPLLCKITRSDLRKYGYVTPKLIFKIIKVKPISCRSENTANAKRDGIDLNKVHTEATGIIKSFEDIRNYYTEPNIITFGDHVAGCKHITESDKLSSKLEGIKLHFMCSDTPSNKRENIIESIKNSGNNLLNQHSVAGEGINIPNLHASIIGRGMDCKTLQQAIGRCDRALNEDTIKFEKGEITLDDPRGWKKYYNLVYLIVDDEDKTFAKRVEDIVRFLEGSGIPQNEWDISIIDDNEKGGAENKSSDYERDIDNYYGFEMKKLNKMIETATVEIRECIEREEEELENMEYKSAEELIEERKAEEQLNQEISDYNKLSNKDIIMSL
jgi:superfamily II DNA or RNA helicase